MPTMDEFLCLFVYNAYVMLVIDELAMCRPSIMCGLSPATAQTQLESLKCSIKCE